MTLNIPASLNCQIAQKAESLGVSFDALVTVLLQYGLEVQLRREKEISELAAAVTSTESEAEQRAAADRLGQFIFGE